MSTALNPKLFFLTTLHSEVVYCGVNITTIVTTKFKECFSFQISSKKIAGENILFCTCKAHMVVYVQLKLCSLFTVNANKKNLSTAVLTLLQQTLVFCRAAGGFQELDSYTGSELVDVIDYLVNNPSALFTLGDHFNSLNIHFANRDFG